MILIVIYPSPWQQVVSSLINETQGEPRSSITGVNKSVYYYVLLCSKRKHKHSMCETRFTKLDIHPHKAKKYIFSKLLHALLHKGQGGICDSDDLATLFRFL